VKIESKSIGARQYQHDLSEFKLSRSLDAVVEDCSMTWSSMSNTARTAAGPGSRIGRGGSDAEIVAHRDAQGPFHTGKR